MSEYTQIINQAIADAKEWLSAAGFKQGDEAMQNTAWELWKEERNELALALLKGDYIQTLDGVIDCAWAWSNLAYFGHSESDTLLQRVITAAEVLPLLDVKLYAEAVRGSNWSKFAKTLADAALTCDFYGNGTHPDKLGQEILAWCNTADAEQTGRYIIKRLSDNKVLKSWKYTPAERIYKQLKEQANESND
jgi:hypothetical protein